MTDIKPIETVYKGYRFRSRLEARWAVFFDALGIKYYYEYEGFDLGDAGWYLPDFWLPDFNTFLEIKPGILMIRPQQRIYFAGKIAVGNDDSPWEYGLTAWRDDLVLGGRERWSTYAEHSTTAPHGDIYAGPRYVDTLGGHGRDGCDGDHGTIPYYHNRPGPESIGRAACCKTCKSQIDDCDVLFAWLDCTDCHGTLVEIGYAIGIGKEVYVFAKTDEIANELWFALHIVPPSHHGVYATAKEAYTDRFDPLLWDVESGRVQDGQQAIAKSQMLAQGTGKNSAVLFGSPTDPLLGAGLIHYAPQGRLAYALSGWSLLEALGARVPATSVLQHASRAAKSARFEHGESGGQR